VGEHFIDDHLGQQLEIAGGGRGTAQGKVDAIGAAVGQQSEGDAVGLLRGVTHLVDDRPGVRGVESQIITASRKFETHMVRV
jgi:hypothetical protein